MANVIDLAGYAGRERGEGFLARLRSALSEYRVYRAVRDELNALSDRDLADIGVSRLNIEAIARQAARGR